MAVKWSDKQEAIFNFVKTGRGNAVVEAVAGSGKTTTIVQAIRGMQGSVFLGAFNKKMAEELKQKTADLKNVRAGTFHSAGFSALRYVLKGTNIETDAKKVRNIVAEMLHDSAEEEWEQAICQLVSMCKQTGFYCQGLVADPKASDFLYLIERYDIMDRLPEDADPRDLIRMAHKALIASNSDRTVIDFDDMVYLPLLLRCRFFQNDWVLIDEAQDTNAVRRMLARKMLKPTGRLIAVGDPRQAIFGFTGADADSLDLIKREFNAVTLALDVTYRCPKAVVRAAREYVSHIHPAATAPEGQHLEMKLQEATALAQPGDAFLCRYNKYLVDQFFKFIRAGKAAKIEGKDEGEKLAALAGRWKKVKTTAALSNRLDKYEEDEVAKAQKKDDEAKVERIQDQVATMRVLIERAEEQGISSVGALQEMIRGMFGDIGESKTLIVLSSVHKSKGLEWPRVFIMGRRQLMPSKRCKQEWQLVQELNLIYVALTRAQETLVDVDMAEQVKPAAARPRTAEAA